MGVFVQERQIQVMYLKCSILRNCIWNCDTS